MNRVAPNPACNSGRAKELFIGLLDIFGSEVFDSNGFEQLLINYANDKLQYYFTQTAIGLVMKLYESEGIDTNLMQHEDHHPTVRMLEGSPTEKVYLLGLLNDESYARSTDETFVSKLELAIAKLDLPLRAGFKGGFISGEVPPRVP